MCYRVFLFGGETHQETYDEEEKSAIAERGVKDLGLECRGGEMFEKAQVLYLRVHIWEDKSRRQTIR